MAKKKGYYSPEAIQARQQAQRDEYFRQEEQKKQTAPKPESPKPDSQNVPKTGFQTPTSGTFTPKPVTPALENLPKAKPYLAYNVTTDGLAVYGNGLRGWLRKAWADLTDPTKYKQDINFLPDDIQADALDAYEGRVEAWAKVIETKTKWSQWGEKFFGLSSEELAALPAGLSTEKQIVEEQAQAEGLTDAQANIKLAGSFLARATRFTVDSTQNAIWGGLELLGLGDQAMRKIHSTALGLDAVADRFNEDESTTVFQKLTQSSIFAMGKDAVTIAQAIQSKKITLEEVTDTVKDYWDGSAMVYSSVFDEAARAEFERGLAEGKDPLWLAQEYGRAGIELAGSVLGDPTTYLGMSLIKPVNVFSKTGRLSAQTIKLFGKTVPLPYAVVGKIPTFGELIGATTGKARLANAGQRFITNSIPELETILKGANDIDNDRAAAVVVNRAVTAVAQKFDDLRKHKRWWNLASVDSAGKVRRISADADYFIKASLTNYGLDETLQMLRDMVLIRRGGQDTADAARRLLPRAGMAFSEVGMMVGEIVSRLDNDNIFEVIKKSKSNTETYTLLTKSLEKAVGDFIPSVDEMLDAERAIKAGEVVTDRMRELADMARDVPNVVKTINRLTRFPEAVAKKTTGGMVQLFMNWVPRSWARNIYGSGVMAALYTDLPTALAASTEALFGSLPKGVSTDVMTRMSEKITRVLGFSPVEATKGLADTLEGGKTRYGFLPAMQRSEQMLSSQIMLKTAEDEIQKALPAVLKDMPEWNELMSILPKEQQSVMNLALKRASGNVDEALQLFRDITGKGEVDAWRLTEPSQDMRNHLNAVGMLDQFYDIQKRARTVDEFKGFVEEFISQYNGFATRAAEVLPSTVTKMPTELQDFGEDLGRLSDAGQRELMGELIQSWQNTLDQLDEVVHGVLRQARRNTGGTPQAQLVEQATDAIHELANAPASQYQAINALREQMHTLKKAVQDTTNPQELAELWKRAIDYKGRKFSLANIYPDMDLSTLTPQTFQKRMWTAFFETSAEVYRNGNNDIYAKSLDAIENLAKSLGTTIEEMAGRPGGDNPFRVLAKMYKQSEDIEDAVSWRRFLNQFNFEKMPVKPDGSPVMLSDVAGKFQDVFKSWKGGQKHIVNAVAKDTGKAIPYEQITLEQAYRAIWKRTRVPPDDGTINDARILWETKDEFLADVERWSERVVNDWGVKVKTSRVDSTEQLRKFTSAFNERMGSVRTAAGRVAVETRNFVLHDYDKTYLDHALTYLFGNSFHYWTTRTYAKSIETLMSNPAVGANYMKYKDYMTKEHANMPEFYRQNVVIQNLLGIDMASPYYLNLEAMINPVYGLTGTDFNDPRKRVDWVSRLVDDSGKMGASFSPLVQWALAAKLYMDGEEGAAQRWLGRLLPQSSVIKSTTAALTGKAIEIDPFVQLTNQKFLGGVDAYERNRVVAALAMMVRDGEITEEQMIDAANSEEGELWEAAVNISAQNRFTGDIASYFIGVGARPRTQEDMIINKFWGDYSTLLNSRSMMTADQYRTAWENLRENPEYGMFVDGLLLGRKTGEAQTTALAYNVLSRIPPGELSDIAEYVGMEAYMIEAFYENKGDISSLTAQDQARFKAAIADLSAILKMPDGATRQEWALAKSTYADMNTRLKDEFGADIQDKISRFYDLRDDERDLYLDAYPEVEQALQRQNQYIVETPILSAYYGGLSAVERYYSNQMYNQLEDEFGADIQDKMEQYYLLKDNLQTSEAKAFYKTNNLKAYEKRKKELQAIADEMIVNAVKNLPERREYEVRPEFQPQGGIQEQTYEYATVDEQAQIAQSIWDELSPAAQTLLQESYETDEVVPSEVKRMVGYIAERYGLTQAEALRLLEIEQ